MAKTRWCQPATRDRPRGCLQGRYQATSSRRLITPSPTFGHSSAEVCIEPLVGGVGDSFDNRLAETINGLIRAEVLHRRGRLAASPPWNTPAANGSTGSTPAPCWNRSETSHRQRPKPISTQFWKMKPWPRSLHYLDSGKPWGCVCDLARSQIIAWKVFAE